jgi:hypothetical protein
MRGSTATIAGFVLKGQLFCTGMDLVQNLGKGNARGGNFLIESIGKAITKSKPKQTN